MDDFLLKEMKLHFIYVIERDYRKGQKRQAPPPPYVKNKVLVALCLKNIGFWHVPLCLLDN
jgi:hypothetical protein